MEIVPELVEFGKNNVKKYNFLERKIVEFVFGDGSKGYEKEAPFDKILVSAAAKKMLRILERATKSWGKDRYSD
jgi:protein-L-isoaspartate(D-aspartate) O-methyltransferase